MVITLAAGSAYADRYWRDGGASCTGSLVWSNTHCWAATSGGATGQSAPDSGDDVFFDSTFTSGCTMDVASATVRSVTISAGSLDVNGHSLTSNRNASVTGGSMSLGAGSFTVANTNNLIIDGGIFNVDSGTLDVTDKLLVRSGTFNANSGTVSISGNTTIGNGTTTSGTFNAGSATVTFNANFIMTDLVGNSFDGGTARVTFGGGTYNVNAGTVDLSTCTSTTISSAAITIESDATLKTGPATTFPSDLQVKNLGTFVGGTGLVTVTGTLAVNSGGTFTGGTGGLTASSTTDASGTFTAGAGPYTFSQAVTNASGTFNLASATALTFSAGTLTVSGGTTTLGSQTVTIPAITVSSSTGVFNAGSAHLTVTGAVTTQGAAGATFNAQTSTTSMASLSMTNGQFNGNSATVNITGASGADVSGGTFTGGTASITTTNDFVVSGGATLATNGTTFTVNHDLSVSGTGTTFTPGSVTLSVANDATFSRSADLSGATLNGTVVGGTLYVSAATTQFGSQTFTVHALTVNGGTLTSSSAHVTVSTDVTIGSGTFTSNSANYGVTGSVTMSGGTFSMTGATWNVTNNLNINSGTAFTPGTVALSVTGDATFAINADFSTAASLGITGTVTVSGGTTQLKNAQSVTFGYLHVGSGGTFTVNGARLTVTNDGTFDKTTDLSSATTLSFGGTVYVTAGTTTFPGGGLTIPVGAISLTGTGGLTTGASTVNVTAGSVTHDVTSTSSGTLNLTATAFTVGHDLTLSSGALTVSAATSLAVSNDMSVAITANLSAIAGMSVTGQLSVTANTTTLEDGLAISIGTISLTGTGRLNLNGADVTTTGAVTIGGGTLDASTAATVTRLTVGGAFSANSGNFTPSTMRLSVANAASFAIGSNLSNCTTVTFSNSVTVTAGTTTLGSQTVSPTSLTVSGGTFDAGSAALTVSGATTLSVGTITLGGGTTSLSTITMSSGAFSSATGAGSLTLSGALSMTGGTFTTSSGATTFQSTAAIQGTTPAAGGTFVVGGTGTTRFQGSVNVGGADSTLGAFSVLAAGTISFEATTTMLAPDSLVLQGPAATTFTVAAAAAITFGTNAIAGTNAVDLVSGTMDLSGSLAAVTVAAGNLVVGTGTTLKTSDADATFSSPSTSTTIDGTLTGGNGALPFPGPVSVNGTFSGGSGARGFAGALTISGTGSYTSSTGAHTFSGAISTDGTFSISTAANTPTFNAGASLTVSGGTTTFGAWGGNTVTVPSLSVSGGTFDAGTNASRLTVSGASSFTGGTVNLASSRIVNLQGAVTASGATAVTLGSTPGCAVTDALGSTLALSLTTGSFTVQSCGLTVAAGVTVTSGTLALGSGSATLSSTLDVPGGTFQAGSGAVTVSGATTVTASGTIDAGTSSSMLFNGPVTLGNAVPTVGRFDTNGGTVTFAGTFSLTNSSTFTGNTGSAAFSVAPTLTSGTFTVGADGTSGLITMTSGATFTTGVSLVFPGDGGELRLGNGTSLVVQGAVSSTWASGSTRPKIDCNGCAAGITVTFRATSTLDLSGLELDDSVAAGVTIEKGATYTLLENLKFAGNKGGVSSTHLAITLGTAVINVPGCIFDATAASNVTLNGDSMAVRGAQAIFEDQDAATNGAGAGETLDADGDSNDDNYGDALGSPYYGSVIQWVKASPSDTTGVASGFPSAAFDWNTFSYYGIYVTYNNVTGSPLGAGADRLWLRNVDGSPAYYWDNDPANGNIVGTPKWDSVNEVTAGLDVNGDNDTTDTDLHVVYIATSGGHIIKLIDTGIPATGFQRPAKAPWNTDFTDSTNVASITSPLIADSTNLYFGATASNSSTWVYGVQIAAGAGEKTLARNVATVSSITTAPSWKVYSGNTYLYVGSTASMGTAYIYRINMTSNSVDAFCDDATDTINDGVRVINFKAYAVTEGGTLHVLDASNFLSGGFQSNMAGFPYQTAAASPIRRSPYVDPFTFTAYFGDNAGNIYAVDSTGAALTGYPYALTGGAAITSTPIYLSNGGVIAIGAGDGTLYFVDRHDGTNTPQILKRYRISTSGSVSSVGYNNSTSQYMVATSDGRLVFVDASEVVDPTSGTE